MSSAINKKVEQMSSVLDDKMADISNHYDELGKLMHF